MNVISVCRLIEYVFEWLLMFKIENCRVAIGGGWRGRGGVDFAQGVGCS